MFIIVYASILACPSPILLIVYLIHASPSIIIPLDADLVNLDAPALSSRIKMDILSVERQRRILIMEMMPLIMSRNYFKTSLKSNLKMVLKKQLQVMRGML